MYKPAFSIEQTMQIVTQEAGRHFDPQLAALLQEWRDTGVLPGMELA